MDCERELKIIMTKIAQEHGSSHYSGYDKDYIELLNKELTAIIDHCKNKKKINNTRY